MNNSAAVWELQSTNLHRTESNECYEPATSNRLSSKNHNCYSKSEVFTVENSSNILKDDKLTIASSEIQPIIQPKDDSIQVTETNNPVDNPTQLMNIQQLYGSYTVLIYIEPEAKIVISKHSLFIYQARILFVE
jgi:hypothetical protein